MSELKVGLTLYTVQDDVIRDMDGSLKAVKEMGYDYVELGGFYGKTPEEVKLLLDKYELKVTSIHMPYSEVLEHTEETLEALKLLDIKCMVIPWMGIENHKGHPGFERSVEEIEKVSQILKEQGIQLMYHNHEFEFEQYEGKYVLDWLYETLTTNVLMPQIDVCWARYGGADPSAYVKKYAGQIKIVHLKDYVCDEMEKGSVYELLGVENRDEKREQTKFGYRPLGQGIQDFPSILKAVVEAGAEYVIVEQDKAETASPMESARISREYLRGLGF